MLFQSSQHWEHLSLCPTKENTAGLSLASVGICCFHLQGAWRRGQRTLPAHFNAAKKPQAAFYLLAAPTASLLSFNAAQGILRGSVCGGVGMMRLARRYASSIGTLSRTFHFEFHLAVFISSRATNNYFSD